MLDLAQAYVETRQHLVDIVLGLDDSRLATIVPASPAWDVRDVAAHLTGIAGDLAGGSIPPEIDLVASLQDPEQAARRDVLTAEQVASRRARSLAGILDEWARHLQRLTPMLAGDAPFPPEAPPFASQIVVTDLATHAQDIRGALGTPGDRESAAVGVALASYAAAAGFKVQAFGLPGLRLRYGDRERLVGAGDPAATLTGDRFEIYRALAGRRSTGQIRAMDWDGDPEPYLPIIPAYGERADPLVE